MFKASELPALAVQRPTLVVVLNLLIVIAGLSALLSVEVRELPDVDRPVVTVRAFFDGASPETMDAEVTSVIENAVARVSGIQSLNAASEENNARVRAEFRSDVDLDVAANDVREAVAAIERRLPEGVEELTVVKADADAMPIVRLALVSDNLSQEALARVAEDEVSTELATIPGVASVDLFGAQREVLRIVVDPLRLAAYKLSIDDLARILRSTSLDVPAGSFKSEDQLLLVRADASVWRPADIEALTLVSDVRLGDVAQVFYGPALPSSYSLLNGRRVVGLNIIRRARSNTIEISAGVDQAIARLNQRLEGTRLVKISDDALFIKGSVREVAISLSIAIIVVVAVIRLFMGAFRPTFIPAVAIPVALIGTIAAIWMLGFSINILTLLALVLATGMIVDDAIIVVENIQRKRAEGLKPMAAAVVGTREVFFAVLATTATLVAVFVPIAFLPGSAGKLFTEFGFVLAIAVILSSFVALTLGPMMGARLTLRERGSEQQAAGSAAAKENLAIRLYRRVLEFTLTARLLVLGVSILLASTALLVYPTITEELLPSEDRGVINLMMQGPDGVGLDYMDRQSAKAEALFEPLRQSGEVTNILATVGRWDPNRVSIVAPLAPWSERQRRQEEISEELLPGLKEIPGATSRIYAPNSLRMRRSGGRLEFALTGADYGDIAAAATDFVEAIQDRLTGVTDPKMDFQQTQPQLTIDVDRRRAEDLGVAVEGVVSTLRAMIDGYEVVELNVDDRSIPVLLQSKAGSIDDPGDLNNLFVPRTDGDLEPLSAFVSLREAGIAAELDRTSQRRAIRIDCDLAPGYGLRQGMDDISALAREILPSDIGLRFINEAATLEDTSHEVALTFGIAILVVLLVLAAQFESLLSALVIVLTVPFGVAAAVFALKLTGTSFNIFSEIGLILLIGLMAKNGILVVEFANQQRDLGFSVGEAIRSAAVVRLRPVMMTMLSTVLGTIPLIYSGGAGAEARNAIGWVVFGGLGIATLFTLLLIPVLYSLLAPFAKPRSHAGGRLEQELRDALMRP